MTVEAKRVRWKERDAITFDNGRMQVVVLAGGGHIAELRLRQEDGWSINLLYESPWKTVDPDSGEIERLGTLYGGMPAGPFLAGFTGHALCLDTFGAPSQEEAEHGIPLHGEASTRIWRLSGRSDGCFAQTGMPYSKLQISRAMHFAGDACVLFVDERLENRSDTAKEVHWVQHVSFGSPLLKPGCCSVASSVDQCKVWPLGYEGRDALVADAEFMWPWAPAVSGGTVDLRTPFVQAGRGFLASARVNPCEDVAYIAALNWARGLALVYCFRREDFPWVAVWEENCARDDQPWNEVARVRGMEFGTTPMPVGKDAIRVMGPLFETPVACILPPHGMRTARYVACAARIPKAWRGIEAVNVTEDQLTLEGAGQNERVTVPVEGIGRFLSKGRTE